MASYRCFTFFKLKVNCIQLHKFDLRQPSMEDPMRKTTIATLVVLAIAAVLAIPADIIYAKRQGDFMSCTATGVTPRTKDQYQFMAWKCDGKEYYSDFVGELRLLKTGETVRCLKWRPLILGTMFGDVITNCSRV